MATQLTDSRRQRLLHALKLIGWGTAQDGKNYWIVENSFGKDWGEGGYGQILGSGQQKDEDRVGLSKGDGIVLESYVIAGTPASSKVDEVEDDAIDAELEDIDDGADL